MVSATKIRKSSFGGVYVNPELPKQVSGKSHNLERTIKVPDSLTRGDEPLVFTIKTEPVAKARARTVYKNGMVMSYTPKKTAEAQEFLKFYFSQFKDQCFGSYVPVKMTVRFYRTNNKKAKRGLARRETMPVRKADLDNYTKLVMDALNHILVADDSQITTIVASKLWSAEPYGYITLILEEDKIV